MHRKNTLWIRWARKYPRARLARDDALHSFRVRGTRLYTVVRQTQCECRVGSYATEAMQVSAIMTFAPARRAFPGCARRWGRARE